MEDWVRAPFSSLFTGVAYMFTRPSGNVAEVPFFRRYSYWLAGWSGSFHFVGVIWIPTRHRGIQQLPLPSHRCLNDSCVWINLRLALKRTPSCTSKSYLSGELINTPGSEIKRFFFYYNGKKSQPFIFSNILSFCSMKAGIVKRMNSLGLQGSLVQMLVK